MWWLLPASLPGFFCTLFHLPFFSFKSPFNLNDSEAQVSVQAQPLPLIPEQFPFVLPLTRSSSQPSACVAGSAVALESLGHLALPLCLRSLREELYGTTTRQVSIVLSPPLPAGLGGNES